MYRIVLEYDDGREAVLEREVSGLVDAMPFAVLVADRCGHYGGDGHGPPKWVNVYCGDHLEIAIAVIPGGLLAASGVHLFRAS